MEEESDDAWWKVHQHHHASPIPGFLKSVSRSGHVFVDSSFAVNPEICDISD